MHRSKRYRSNKELIENSKLHSIDEAIEIIQKLNQAKFDETVEVHFRLNINPEKTEQQVRGNVELPHGTGKKVRIAVFAEGASVLNKAKKAGAEVVGGDDLIEEIRTKGKINFDIAIATPDMMPKLAKIAKVLGPKGLMPNPKSETVTAEVEKAVSQLAKGKITFKSDKLGNVHVALGKISFDPQALKENYELLKKALEKLKPSGIKGKYFRSITLTSTMGPGLKLA